jgi:hypothetical protein
MTWKERAHYQKRTKKKKKLSETSGSLVFESKWGKPHTSAIIYQEL